MWRKDRHRARQVSEYMDALIVQRRADADPLDRLLVNDEELHELQVLMRALTDIEMVPPSEFGTECRRQLSRVPQEPLPISSRHKSIGRLVRKALRSERRPWPAVPRLPRKIVTSALVAAFLIALPAHPAKPPLASAEEILTLSDVALARVVRPGEVYYRRWRLTFSGRDAEGIREERIAHEWLDGSDLERVASHNLTPEGRLLFGYLSERYDGEVHSSVYFAPAFSDDPRGALHLEPTSAELRQALERTGRDQRPLLRTYLERHYMYTPILGERRFNRAMLNAPKDPNPLLRVMLAFDDTGMLSGMPVYRVQVVDPARVRFRWRSDGPPAVSRSLTDTVRYINRDSYLTLKSVETHEYADGARVVVTRELEEARTIRAADLTSDPFRLEVPAGTPTRRQSASDLLAGVAAVLEPFAGAGTSE